MTKPLIELKSISVNERLSEETTCYSASLYVDGERWGDVCNRGFGGADDFRSTGKRTYKDLDALDARIKATYEPYVSSDGTKLPMDLELVCAEIIEQFLMVKEVRKLTKGKVAFCDDAKIYTVKSTDIDKTIAAVRQRRPNAVIINGLPDDQAVEILRQAA